MKEKMKVFEIWGIAAIMLLITIASATAIPATLDSSKTFTSASDDIDRGISIYQDQNDNAIILGHNLSTQCSIGTYDPSAFTFAIDEFVNGTTNYRFADCNGDGSASAIGMGIGEFYYIHQPSDLRNTTFDSTSFASLGNIYSSDDIDCSLIGYAAFDVTTDIAVTDDFVVAAHQGADNFYMCQLSPKTEISPTADFISGLTEIETIDYNSNRVASYNTTHILVLELNNGNNITQMNSPTGDGCSQTHQGGVAPIDIDGYNGWIFTLDSNGQDIHVYNGLTCNYEETATLDTLECGVKSASSGTNGFFVDTDGIHCVDDLSGTFNRMKRYSVSWDYPTVPPTTTVTSGDTCSYPCIFNETFQYVDTVCDHGWSGFVPSVDCDNAKANGTHLYCPTGLGYGITRNFDSVSLGNAIIELSFDISQNADTTYFIDVYGSSPSLEHAVSLTFDSFLENVYAGSDNIGSFTPGTSDNYTVRMNLDTGAYSVFQNGIALSQSEPFEDEGIDDLSSVVLGSSVGGGTCVMQMDNIRLDVISSPGSTPVGIGVNQSDNVFIRNEVTGAAILGLEWNNFFFDDEAAGCGERNYQFCFMSTIFTALSSAFIDFMLRNILFLIAFAIAITLIGLIYTGKVSV